VCVRTSCARDYTSSLALNMSDEPTELRRANLSEQGTTTTTSTTATATTVVAAVPQSSRNSNKMETALSDKNVTIPLCRSTANRARTANRQERGTYTSVPYVRVSHHLYHERFFRGRCTCSSFKRSICYEETNLVSSFSFFFLLAYNQLQLGQSTAIIMVLVD
jgi:hypothetical protein